MFATEELSLLERFVQRLTGPKVYPADSGVAQACHDLIREVGTGSGLQHRSQLLRIAAIVLEAEFQAARRKGVACVPRDHRVDHVLAKLSADDLLAGLVQDLADRFNCTRRHLNRLFH